MNKFLHKWASDLFPINRSITGKGVRDTLSYIKDIIPNLNVYSIPSGKRVFDWVIPNEWEINEAFIEDQNGNRVIDFANNNLHVVGYSEPVDKWIDIDELNNYLHSIPEQPNAIPYVTSYYNKTWGFCLSENQRSKLKDKKYHAVIRSKLKKGFLNYGELIIPGKSKKEILLSTYICHPSMANNEDSGQVVTAAIAKELEQNKLNYTIRIVFIPETIGSIAYLFDHYQTLKKMVIAGFNITCVGDNNCYSYLPSRDGNSISDKAALHALKHVDSNFIKYSWLDRGSDERQYCAPGIDLPIASILRSKYGEYPEYHTSLDDLSFISEDGLQESVDIYIKVIKIINENYTPKPLILCEPNMGKRGLYSLISKQNSNTKGVIDMMNIISLCDGVNTILDISEEINLPFWDVNEIIKVLIKENIVSPFK